MGIWILEVTMRFIVERANHKLTELVRENGIVESVILSEENRAKYLHYNVELSLRYDKETNSIIVLTDVGNQYEMVGKADLEELFKFCMTLFSAKGDDIAERTNAAWQKEIEDERAAAQRERDIRIIKEASERRAAKRLEHRPGYVYLISNQTDFYKVGRSKDPVQRLRHLSGGDPSWMLLHTIKCHNMFTAELDLHDRFFDKRQEGEWFALTPEDVQSIKSIESM